MARRYRHRSNGRSRKLFLRQIWRTQRTAIARRPPHGHRCAPFRDPGLEHLTGSSAGSAPPFPDRNRWSGRERSVRDRGRMRGAGLPAGVGGHAARFPACLRSAASIRRVAGSGPARRWARQARHPDDAEAPSTAAGRGREVAGPGGRVPVQAEHPPVRESVGAAAGRPATFRATRCDRVRPARDHAGRMRPTSCGTANGRTCRSPRPGP